MYAVVSKALGNRFFFHLGMGNGNFQPDSALLAGVEGRAVFAAASARITQMLSLNANWYGSDLALGVSIAPLENRVFVITPHVQDLLGVSGNGPRLVISAVFAENFLR
jgi:hypothetical protein